MPTPVVHPIVVTRDESHTRAMITWRAAGVTLKPADRLNLLATTSPVISPVPTDYRSALANPHWRAAMQDEFKALIDNVTWTLVPRPAGANIVSSKWVFKHKFHLDGTLSLATKLAGSFEGTLNALVSIMMRHSVQSSSQPPSGWF
jgi:hypothetical protein